MAMRVAMNPLEAAYALRMVSMGPEALRILVNEAAKIKRDTFIDNPVNLTDPDGLPARQVRTWLDT